MRPDTDLLDQTEINRQLANAGSCARVQVLDQCDSTNAVLGREAAGSADGMVVTTEVQTSGRGRRGRSWIAPPGGSLAFSMLWHFNRGALALSGLSLVAGVAVVSALARLGDVPLTLKWPNDILSAGAKLGGILTETRIGSSDSGPIAAIIGVGLNVRLSSDDYRAVAVASKGAPYPVTDLARIVAVLPSRNELLALIVTELASHLALFDREGFVAFQERWNGMHALRDQWVTVLDADGAAIDARAIGAAADGALIVDVAGERRFLHGGEVTLRQRGGRAADPSIVGSRKLGTRA
jgi:BirA family transcriptional regulator, biotin operon repressor / biotin---[acetyl-CoA-carboxylase] ligase